MPYQRYLIRSVFFLVFLTSQLLAVSLEESFVSPPDSARPHTWWHWMNGNISPAGITRDLTELQNVGVRGVQLFTVSLVPEGPVTFMSPEYRELVHFAVSEANRLGLEVCLHNCAGWSSSGGPWVTPAESMQMVVWSSRHLTGPGRMEIQLPQPLTRRDHYREISTIAFPTPPDEAVSLRGLQPILTTGNKRQLDRSDLTDGDWLTYQSLSVDATHSLPFVDIEFDAPQEIVSLKLVCGPVNYRWATLQAKSPDGTFQTIHRFRCPKTHSNETDWFSIETFPTVTARVFRLLFSEPPHVLKPVTIAELELGRTARIPNLLSKAAYKVERINPEVEYNQPDDSSVVQLTDIVDLTDNQKESGLLTWQVPEGDWTILRFGYTTTARPNHPAPPSGTGLECDKLSQTAVKAHFDAMTGVLLSDTADLAGKTINNVLVDSYETGPQNWTENFASEFEARNGYKILPWLVSLTGRYVNSATESEAFLWDFRNTIGELWEENYYRYFADLAHDNDLLLSVEGYGNGIFDSLQAARSADIPMSEFWIRSPGFQSRNYETLSAACLDGEIIVGAEAFTSGPEGWECDLAELRQLGDLMFATGINRFIFHTYAHQPWLERQPGMSMGVHGHQFNCNNTWWPSARPWVDYVSRCQFLLQQGQYVADVLYFAGEGRPNEFSMSGFELPPPGYSYAVCDRQTLIESAQVRNNKIVLPHGQEYALLVMPPCQRYTPQLLEAVSSLVRDGAIVVMPRPTGSPSLVDRTNSDNRIRKLVNEVWQGQPDEPSVQPVAYQQGKIYWGQNLSEILETEQIKPDVTWSNPEVELRWFHRQSNGVDIYLVSNRLQQQCREDVSFRCTGRLPEIWDAYQGQIQPAAVFEEADFTTRVQLNLPPGGSCFVVFQKPLTDQVRVTALQLPPQQETKEETSLIINRAVYGVLDDPEKSVDVTDILRAKIDQNRLRVPADNNLAGDPAYQEPKSLFVDFALDGQPQHLVVRENEVLELPTTPKIEQPVGVLNNKGNGQYHLTAFQEGDFEIVSNRGHHQTISVGTMEPLHDLSAEWQVIFPQGWGAPDTAQFDRLLRWELCPEPGIRHFSGTATYIKEFDFPDHDPQTDWAWWLDLGSVYNLATVSLNGHDLGCWWYPPYRQEVTDLLRYGRSNLLQIEVTNLWPNRMIGDCQPGIEGTYTSTTFNPYDANSPLLPSGLEGPVTLQPAVKVTVQVE